MHVMPRGIFSTFILYICAGNPTPADPHNAVPYKACTMMSGGRCGSTALLEPLGHVRAKCQNDLNAKTSPLQPR